MKINYTHDIIVIGAGSGGLTSAIFMQKAGFKVLLIDRRNESFGGDCLNYGCIPSKSLLHVAHLIYNGQKASAFQSQHSGIVDIKKVMQYIQGTQSHIRAHENPDYLANTGIDIAIGEATFTDEQTISVANVTYSAKRIIIATGSRPRALEIKGGENLPLYTNETIFAIETLPKHFVFIGGGPINIELGQAFSRLGSDVTIIQTSERILSKEDPEVSKTVQRILEDEGMTVLCDTSVVEVTVESVIIKDVTGAIRAIPADAIFVGIGRIPNIESLDVEKANILCDDKDSPILDGYLRTTNKRVAIIGDAAGNHMFTHAAELQASLVIRNLFSPIKRKYSSRFMAWTTFSDPEIATFGASRDVLDSSKTSYTTISIPLTDDDRAITENATEGFLMVYMSPTGKLLGGVMVGNHAGEVVSELVLMMSHGIKLKDILGKTFPYPVASRVIQTVARKCAGERLESPAVRRLLKVLYR